MSPGQSLSRFRHARRHSARRKAMARRILQSFNNLETNVRQAVGTVYSNLRSIYRWARNSKIERKTKLELRCFRSDGFVVQD
jgi:hypothetical protein